MRVRPARGGGGGVGSHQFHRYFPNEAKHLPDAYLPSTRLLWRRGSSDPLSGLLGGRSTAGCVVKIAICVFQVQVPLQWRAWQSLVPARGSSFHALRGSFLSSGVFHFDEIQHWVCFFSFMHHGFSALSKKSSDHHTVFIYVFF